MGPGLKPGFLSSFYFNHLKEVENWVMIG